ncbi:hypothetical protein [Anaerocolumna jejuensis]|uniref:hypothetical protein n=1 Tax=Anaerocolumna jejuensis TaxID=259063 RepID=UPI003F7B431D
MLWYSVYIIMSLLCLEAIIFFIYFIIKILIEKHIKINYSIKKVRRFLVSNIIICSLAIGISYGYYAYNYIGENEIVFLSQHDVKEVTELLDKNNFDYKILIGKKIKFQNLEDTQNVITLIAESGISYKSSLN